MKGIIITTAKNAKADFYIQSIGSSAGNPVKKPSANCFKVVCDRSVWIPQFVYHICLLLWSTGKIQARQKGTAVAYITIKDVQDALREHLTKMQFKNA